MIFIDSNVPMYLVGKPHPNRDRLENYLRANPGRVYVTSAEVFQEIVHRYVAIDRRTAIDDAFDLLDALAEMVFPIGEAQVRRAAEISKTQRQLSGRDCLHLAVMESHGVDTVLSCDRGFDVWPHVTRLPSS